MNTQAQISRPSNLPFGRWLGDFEPLSDAEKDLVAQCAKGEDCVLGGKRPEERTDANTIRAGLIRFLALGGDAEHPVHERGVQLEGAWVTERLDLSNCEVKIRLALWRCHFAEEINVRNANLDSLYLNGSAIHKFSADGVKVAGDVFLRNNFSAKGEFRLHGASIGGDLDCSDGSFENANSIALQADGIKVIGDVNLKHNFSTKGEVRLLGASIGGDLTCSGGTFDNAAGNSLSADRIIVAGGVFLNAGFSSNGKVRLLGARIGSNLDCSGGSFQNANSNALSIDLITVGGNVYLNDKFSADGKVSLISANIGGNLSCFRGNFGNVDDDALIIQGANIKGSLELRGAKIIGNMDMAAAHVGTLVDGAEAKIGAAPSCWGEGRHILDGFTYARIFGATDALSRIAWLKTQRDDQLNVEDWAPQPWEQLIKVLREMGHPHEAAKVAIEKQHLMRKAGKIGKPPQFASPSNPKQAVIRLFVWVRDWLSCQVRNGYHWLSGKLIGYGYDPARAFVLLLIAAGLFGCVFQYGYEAGYFGPTNAVIQMRYHELCGAPRDFQSSIIPGRPHIHPEKLHWNDARCTPPEYTSFQPWLYSLDVILPVVSLGQDSDWSPMVMNANSEDLSFGIWLRRLIVFEILFGWFVTLLLAAVMTNLIKRD